MKKTAVVLAAIAAIGMSAVVAPSPAEARIRGFGPALAGGLVAGAVIGGPAYAWGPGYGYYDGYAPAYYGGGYGPEYYGAYDYDYDVAPYRWGGSTTTTYYAAPVYTGYRRVVRPAFAYYGGPYPRWHHRWHRYW
jgi:hypothetical protein